MENKQFPPTLVDSDTFNLIFEAIDISCPLSGKFVELGSFLGGSITRIAQYMQEQNR